jgi:peptidoglycan/LPS O-acetylase OafA/YrhL
MSKNQFFPALTGLRAIAAYMVFCHHFNPISKLFLSGFVYEFFNEFHVGVTLFFVLSGFLITNRYFELPKINLKKYLLNRFARIYPMYFLLSSLTFLVSIFLYKQNSWKDLQVYFLNITLLKGYFDNIKFSGIGQGWSLTVEEFFYLFAPLFFIFVKKSKIYLFLLPLFFVATGIILVCFFEQKEGFGFMKSIPFMFDFTFFGRCIEFFIGMTLALFLKKIPVFNHFNYTFFGIVSFVFWIFLLSVQKTPTGFGTDCVFGKIINNLLLPVFGIVPLFIGLILERNWISKFLSSKIMQLLGKSSYVFYLIHLGIFYKLFDKFFGNLLIIFILLNIISILMYKLLEEPINRFFRRTNT